MNNGQMDRGDENLTHYLPWKLREKKKSPVRLVGTGFWARQLPNMSGVVLVSQNNVITIALKIFQPVC